MTSRLVAVSLLCVAPFAPAALAQGSSMASGSDHIDHVRTQLPYAVLVGAVAVLFGTLPTGFGAPWWLSLALGTSALVVAQRVIGRPLEPSGVSG